MESPKTRVLVTGGNGFTGYHVIKELNERGCRVLSIDTAEHRDDVDACQEQMDLHSDALCIVLDTFKPDRVIHLAAVHYIPYCNEHPLETFNANVMGTARLLRALPKSVKSVFAASSAAVYQPSQMPHSEASPTWPNDIYGFTKVAMEYMLRKWSADNGVPVCRGRYFNMYGWGETTPHLIPVIVQQVLDGNRHIHLGNITTRRDYVRVEDNARSTVILTLMGYNGAINLGTGVSYSAKDIVAMIGMIDNIDLVISSQDDRKRQVDRPNLVADMTTFNIANLPRPVDIITGLAELLDVGVGPYVREDL